MHFSSYSLEIIERYFPELVADQEYLSTPERWSKMLALLPGDSILSEMIFYNHLSRSKQYGTIWIENLPSPIKIHYTVGVEYERNVIKCHRKRKLTWTTMTS